MQVKLPEIKDIIMFGLNELNAPNKILILVSKSLKLQKHSSYKKYNLNIRTQKLEIKSGKYIMKT